MQLFKYDIHTHTSEVSGVRFNICEGACGFTKG